MSDTEKEKKDIIEANDLATRKAEERPVTPGWVRGGFHNDLLRCDGFTVSYQPNDYIREFLTLRGIGLSGTSSERPETALVVGDACLILSGDHREQYGKLAKKGLRPCIAYFEENREKFPHFWSNSLDDVKV